MDTRRLAARIAAGYPCVHPCCTTPDAAHRALTLTLTATEQGHVPNLRAFLDTLAVELHAAQAERLGIPPHEQPTPAQVLTRLHSTPTP